MPPIMRRTHYRVCHLCEAMCGVAIEVDGDAILSVRGDEEDLFSRGHVCPKAVALKDVHEDPDRLKRPLRRTATGWEELGWDEALDEAASRLQAVQREHGRGAVAVYQGNPTVHNYGSILFGQAFTTALGSHTYFSATSVDQLPHMLAALSMFGHQLLLPIPDLDRIDFLLVLGANPVASNGSLMTAPDVAARLGAIVKRGGSVVVVDPRRTETAEIASEHHFIRPGADAWLLMAILHTLFAEDRVRPGRLATFTDGLADVARLAAPFSPERVAPAVGIAAETIRALARELAASPRAACYGRVGLCTQEHGGVAAWLVNVLNVVTGNLDREGGVMLTRPAVDIVGLASRIGQRGSFGRRKSRVRGLPVFSGELPAAVGAAVTPPPGRGAIRARVPAAATPALPPPTGGGRDRALASLDFMVSIDIYLNETTRHANLILPPTFALEHDHYDLAFHALAIRNTARYSEPLFERGPDQRHDWEILLGLARRLAPDAGPRGWLSQAGAGLAGKLGPAGALDLLLRTGPWGDRFLPGSRGLSLARLRAAPHGIDLGPLEPCLPDRLATPRKRIDLAPAIFTHDVRRLEERLAAATAAAPGAEASLEGPELVLIGRRDLRSNNSWMHNARRLVKGRERCTLLMHPDDAARRGLSSGERVLVRSRVGAVAAPLEITPAMMPGVVSLPHGFGHGRPGVRLAVAAEHAGVSVNDLTDEAAVDPLSGTAVLNGVPVTVERETAAPPAPAQ